MGCRKGTIQLIISLLGQNEKALARSRAEANTRQSKREQAEREGEELQLR